MAAVTNKDIPKNIHFLASQTKLGVPPCQLSIDVSFVKLIFYSSSWVTFAAGCEKADVLRYQNMFECRVIIILIFIFFKPLLAQTVFPLISKENVSCVSKYCITGVLMDTTIIPRWFYGDYIIV